MANRPDIADPLKRAGSLRSTAKQACRPEDCSQISWGIAEVVYNKHGEAAVRQGIVKYHQNDDGNAE
jgi:hypothetical protein